MQTPSWTDRILHKPMPGIVINQETAGCADEIQTSDHTPVFSTFNMKVPLPPPADDVKFLKCTIHVSNVSLINPRVVGENYGGGQEEEEKFELLWVVETMGGVNRVVSLRERQRKVVKEEHLHGIRVIYQSWDHFLQKWNFLNIVILFFVFKVMLDMVQLAIQLDTVPFH